MPPLVLLLLLAAAQDPVAIMERSVAANQKNQKQLRQYAYRERRVDREVDASGRQTGWSARTWDVIGLEGSTYRRLVAIDDQPLPPKQEAREQKRLREEAGGRPAYLLEGTPNPAFQPRPGQESDRDWKNFALRLWVDQQDHLCARMETDVLGDGSRLQKGTKLRQDFVRLEDGVRAPQDLQIGYRLRVMKLFTARGHVAIGYSEYRKFQVDSRLLDAIR